MTFQELPLRESLLKSLTDRGFVNPTEIQAEAIPFLIENESDLVAQAQTGTGKTLAFALPLLQKIDNQAKDVQALILTPTRELANQVCEEIKKLAGNERIKTLSVYGGVSLEGQIKGLRKDRPQIVVGTPGRVLDLIERGVLKLEHAKTAILDEADEMLDMGFIDDVQTILSELGDEKKTWMFSATMPGPILNLIKTYLHEPKIIKIQKKTLSNASIEQIHYVVKYEHMSEAVCRILDSLDEYYGMIFCRTKIEAKNLADELNSRGYPSDSLHGDMSQQQRDITMKNFKNKKINMLVCTDVAARGIDVDNLTHVINFGLPQDIESYVHRIGRTGRAGQTGIALTIIEPSERYRLRQVENITKAPIKKEMIPTTEMIKDVLIKKELAKIDGQLSQLGDLDIHTKFTEKFEALSKEDVLKVFFNHLFQEQMHRYDKLPNLDVVERKRTENTRTQTQTNSRDLGRGRSAGNVRFFVNIGREHGITLKMLLNSISGMVNVDERQIRNVDLKESFSFLEIPEKFSDTLLNFQSPVINDKRVRFELTKTQSSQSPSSSRGSFRDRRPAFREGGQARREKTFRS